MRNVIAIEWHHMTHHICRAMWIYTKDMFFILITVVPWIRELIMHTPCLSPTKFQLLFLSQILFDGIVGSLN